MTMLLKTEWLKIKNYMAFKILAIFFGAGVILTNYIVYAINKNIVHKSPTGQMILSSFNPYEFTKTWQTTSYTTGYLLILPAMLIIILLTNEYTYRTSRQNIIDGWSRSQFIEVKLQMALLAAVFTTVLVILTALGFGLTSGTSFSFSGFSHIGFFFLKALSYNMFAVFISVLVKKTGFAIGLYFIYLGAENLLSFMLDFASGNIKTTYGRDLGSMGDYLPLSSSDGLLTFPDNPMKAAAKSLMPADYTWVVAGFALLYLFLFMYWSRRRFMRADL
ncbi:MAG: hypothetical protein WKF88_10585 [Ferruginibacter sp.]